MTGGRTGTVTSADGAVFGGSSGAGLVLQAAARNPAITRLALWEPPYHVDDSAPRLPDDFAVQLDGLVRAGRRAEAVELFLVKAAEASPRDVAALRGQPFWPAMEAAAQTLAYEALRIDAAGRRGGRQANRPDVPGGRPANSERNASHISTTSTVVPVSLR